MKKSMWLLLILAASVVLAALAIPIGNDHMARQVHRQLLSIPLPEKTELADSLCEAGKLVGNGNGMQYFSALLVKSELSAAQLEAYYAPYRQEPANGPFVKVQAGRQIAVLDRPLQFSAAAADAGYYIVYLWGGTRCPFLNLDLRGH